MTAPGQEQQPSPPTACEADLLAEHYDYHLPEELIADHPAERRDASRLLVVPRNPGGALCHASFRELEQRLGPGDLLVLNDSRVLPARLFGQRQPGGGTCELLLLEPLQPDGAEERWRVMARPGKKLKTGTEIRFGEGFSAVVEAEDPSGTRIVRFRTIGGLRAALDQHGQMPLPPYILARRGERDSRPEDRERYQTVYARLDGSVAAPTAGLHFTPELLDRLRTKGVEVRFVTLHVGAGTFKPVTADRMTDHDMHHEWWSLPRETAEAISRAKREGRRLVAVGTTTVRTLEAAALAQDFSPGNELAEANGSTDLMILPGYRFRLVDALVTNFHLPRSTLLCLVAALTGRERLLAIYAEAVREGYRFYSYGDAMLIEGAASPATP